MNLIDKITESVTIMRKKRDKFVVVSSVPLDIIPQPLAVVSANPSKGESMPTMKIQYVKGTGKENKAEFKLGKASVPASVISRTIKETEGKPENRKAFIIYGKLQKNYGSFLEALDAASLDYVDALNQMKELRPQKAAGTAHGAGKVQRTAVALAKPICKRFKGTPEEMIEAFLEAVNSPEFKKETIDIISANQKNFGKSALGFTKTSNRKGNPNAMKALEKVRKQKANK